MTGCADLKARGCKLFNFRHSLAYPGNAAGSVFSSKEPSQAALDGANTSWKATLNDYPVMIVTLARAASENANYTPGQAGVDPSQNLNQTDPLGLSDDERALIAAAVEAKKANNGKVIVLLNNASAMEVQELEDNEGASAIRGAQAYGVIAAPKHVAFNDSEANRTGVAMFITEQKAREGELRAEQSCFEDAGALGAMTAYNRVGVYTSNAHPTMLKNIVRGEWGFKGLMSEDFIMDASYVTLKEAVINGVTMSCNTGENSMEAVSNKYPGWTVDNVKDDPTLTAALKQAMTWQAYALANSNAMDGYSSSSRLERVSTWYDTALTAASVAFAVLTAGCLAMYVVSRKKEN